MTDIVYRTDATQVVEAWLDKQAEHDAWNTRLKQQLSDWGFPEGTSTFTINTALGGYRLAGVAWPENEEVPKYWRRDRAQPQSLRPRRSSKAGQAIDDEFTKLVQIPQPRSTLEQFGMPTLHLHSQGLQTYASTCAAVFDGTYVWVMWKESGPAEVDQTIWQGVALSSYYALVEAGDDPFNPTATEDAKDTETAGVD